MGLFDFLKGKSSDKPRNKTLIAIDWDRVQGINTDFQFLQKHKNQVIWFFYKRVSQTDQWSKITQKHESAHKQMPAYEHQLSLYLAESVVHEVVSNPVYSKVVVVSNDDYLRGLAKFLSERGIAAEMLVLNKGGAKDGRDGKRERGDRPERGDRAERGDRGDRREREPREPRSEREPRGEREPRPERTERPAREPRPERPAREPRPERPVREPRPVAEGETEAHEGGEEPKRTSETVNRDISRITDIFPKHFNVGEVYAKSDVEAFPAFIAGKPHEEIFGNEDRAAYIGCLVQNLVIEDLGDGNVKVLRNPKKLPLLELAMLVPPAKGERRDRGERSDRDRGPRDRGGDRDGDRRRGRRGGRGDRRDRGPRDENSYETPKFEEDSLDQAAKAAEEAYEKAMRESEAQ